MKNGISLLAVAALMLAAPTFGAENWIGGTNNLFNTAANWDNNVVPDGSTFITNGDSVLLEGVAGDI